MVPETWVVAAADETEVATVMAPRAVGAWAVGAMGLGAMGVGAMEVGTVGVGDSEGDIGGGGGHGGLTVAEMGREEDPERGY